MLLPLVIRAPGFGGLNLEGEDIVADAHFARAAENFVFDNAGRLACRQAYSQLNDLDGSDSVESIFVYDSTNGNSVISALADHIFEDATDKQGSLAHTTANWQFQNFNGKVLVASKGRPLLSIMAQGTLLP